MEQEHLLKDQLLLILTIFLIITPLINKKRPPFNNDGQFLSGGGSATTIVSRIQDFITYCKLHFKNAKIYIGFIAWTKGT